MDPILLSLSIKASRVNKNNSKKKTVVTIFGFLQIFRSELRLKNIGRHKSFKHQSFPVLPRSLFL